jgi:hypothetical protein
MYLRTSLRAREREKERERGEGERKKERKYLDFTKKTKYFILHTNVMMM